MQRKYKENRRFTPIPNHIAELRKKAGMTTDQLCVALEIPKGTYVVWESGHSLPTSKWMTWLCKAFNCQPNDMYSGAIVDIINEYGE